MTQDYLEPPIVMATYKLFLAFAPLLYRFPKLYRYTLGQAIENTILALLEQVFEANTLPKPLREMPIVRANSRCEQLKLLVRLSFELKVLESTQYFQFTAQLKEIGRMLGGWINYVRNGANEKREPKQSTLLEK